MRRRTTTTTMMMMVKMNKSLCTHLFLEFSGGDGSVTWVLSSELSVFQEQGLSMPPVAIIPQGTGNDLSRVFGWGGGVPLIGGTLVFFFSSSSSSSSFLFSIYDLISHRLSTCSISSFFFPFVAGVVKLARKSIDDIHAGRVRKTPLDSWKIAIQAKSTSHSME